MPLPSRRRCRLDVSEGEKILPVLHVGKIVNPEQFYAEDADHLSFGQIKEVDQKYYKRNKKPQNYLARKRMQSKRRKKKQKIVKYFVLWMQIQGLKIRM